MIDTESSSPENANEICIPFSKDSDKLNSKFEIKPISFFIINLIKLAIPNTLNGLAWTAQALIGIYFVGRLNNTKLLDGVSLGSTWVSICGFSIVNGLSSAMDTFISQAYGKKDYLACGLILNKAFIIVGILALPCIILIWSSKIMFSLFEIDPDVTMYSYKYSMACIPVVFLYIPQLLIEKFLIGQQISKPQMIFQILNALIFPLHCYFNVIFLDFGIYGVALSRAFASIVYIGMMLAYIRISECCSRSIIIPTIEVFYGWNEYLKVAIPSLLMICLAWWGLEIMNLLSGKIGVIDLASNTIGFNYSGTIWLMCLGVGISCGTLVGNSIGEHNILYAKTYAFVGIFCTLALILTLDLTLLIFRPFFAGLFTNDPQVIHVLETLIYFITMQEIFDGSQATLGKILFGMGRQKYASVINLIAYYIFMIPLGILFGLFLKWGVYGIYTAYTIAGITVTIGFSFILYNSNWDEVIKLADEKFYTIIGKMQIPYKSVSSPSKN